MINTDFLKSLLFSWLRHATTGWAAWLISKGLLQSDQTVQFEGLVLLAGSLGYAAIDKYLLHRVVPVPPTPAQPTNPVPPAQHD